MKKSTIYLFLSISASALIIVVLIIMFMGTKQPGDVNLETLSAAYTEFVKSGSDDLSVFEKRVNTKDIYDGPGHIKLDLNEKGSLIGYLDDNKTLGYQSSDTMMFNLEAEKETESIVAKDSNERYYRHHSPGIFHYLLISRMLSTQQGYYGGRYYRAPASANYQKSGYHNRLKASGSSSSSRSARSGSYGSRRTSGGSSGFGK